MDTCHVTDEHNKWLCLQAVRGSCIKLVWHCDNNHVTDGQQSSFLKRYVFNQCNNTNKGSIGIRTHKYMLLEVFCKYWCKRFSALNSIMITTIGVKLIKWWSWGNYPLRAASREGWTVRVTYRESLNSHWQKVIWDRTRRAPGIAVGSAGDWRRDG